MVRQMRVFTALSPYVRSCCCPNCTIFGSAENKATPVLPSPALFLLAATHAMSSNFSEAIASMHLGNDKGSARAGKQTPGSASSVESSYTRRGQTESDAEIRDGFAAVRDAASRNRRIETDVLSSSPRHAAAAGGASAGFAVPLAVRRRRESRSTEQEGDELARELDEEARTRNASNDGDASGSGTRTPLPDTSKSASSRRLGLSS